MTQENVQRSFTKTEPSHQLTGFLLTKLQNEKVTTLFFFQNLQKICQLPDSVDSEKGWNQVKKVYIQGGKYSIYLEDLKKRGQSLRLHRVSYSHFPKSLILPWMTMSLTAICLLMTSVCSVIWKSQFSVQLPNNSSSQLLLPWSLSLWLLH